jgi:heterodisulfide reductase subunit B
MSGAAVDQLVDASGVTFKTPCGVVMLVFNTKPAAGVAINLGNGMSKPRKGAGPHATVCPFCGHQNPDFDRLLHKNAPLKQKNLNDRY